MAICTRGILALRLRQLAGFAATLLLVATAGVDAFVVVPATTTTSATTSATTTAPAPAGPSCGRAGTISRTRRETRFSSDAALFVVRSDGGDDKGDAAAASGPKDDDDDDVVVVVHVPANGVKVGALRFLLQMYVVGQQNHQVPNSWLTRASDDSNDIIVYNGDGTAALRVRVRESGVEFSRMGERPSLPYLLQESVLLHGILDELENAALGGVDGDIDESNRLLRLADSGDLAGARAELPARKLGS